MSTYGSRDKNPFNIPGSNKKYYLLVEDNGDITIKSPTTTGNIIGSNGDLTLGVLKKGQTSITSSASLSESEKNYFLSNNNIRSIKNQAVLTVQKSGVSSQNAQQLVLSNASQNQTTQAQTSGGAQTPTNQQEANSANTTVAAIGGNTLTVGSSIQDNFGSSLFRYPINSAGTGQDYIKFQILEYGGRDITQAGGRLDTPFGNRNIGTNPKSTIYLPIQSGITDENSVQWGGESLDAITAYFAGKSLQTMEQGPGSAIRDFSGDIGGALKNKIYADALKVYLAGQAVGTNSLLSRATGTLVNPNLELLFQGPQLRPFNFNFKLSPRSKEEADIVKAIIRSFKLASAVKVVAPTLFLKAPNVFKISYIDGETGSTHRSINQIKTCALTSVSVNYTPLNTYMTFNDPEKSMVSYDLSLRFSELDPVTNADYQDNHSVGY